MKYEIEIRLSTIEDTAAMREVAIRSYYDTFADSNTPADMESFLSDNYSLTKMESEFYETNSALYLAIENEKVIGFLRLRKNNEVEHTLGINTIELQRLYIHTAHQGKRVGYKLMEKAMEYATQHDFEWIWLGVWERNFKAQEFYNKWGFERFGEHVFQMGVDPQIDWLLRKRLSNF